MIFWILFFYYLVTRIVAFGILLALKDKQRLGRNDMYDAMSFICFPAVGEMYVAAVAVYVIAMRWL